MRPRVSSARTVNFRAKDAADSGVFGIVLAVIAVIALVVVIPAMILAEPNTGRSSAWILTSGVLVMSGVRISYMIKSGSKRLFEFIYWLFCYVFFGLAPTVQLRMDQMPTTTKGLDPRLDVPTAIFSIAGILAIALGFSLAGRFPGKGHGERPIHVISVLRLSLLTGGAVLASIYMLARTGIGALFSSRAEFSDVKSQLWPDPSTAAMIAAVSAFPILIAAHGWWEVSRSGKNKRAKRVLAMMLTVASLLITNPISSARYHFGVVWGSFLGTAGAYRNPRRTSVTMISIVLGLLFLFPVADLFRRKDIVSVQRTGFLSEYAGNGDYDAFGQLSNSLLYNATEPFSFGHELLGSLFFWVPRSIWSDKPTGAGVLLAEFRGYNFTNLSAPIWAELLLNFGLYGAVLASVLIGFLLGRLDARFMRSQGQGGDAIMASVLPFYLLILMRGSLLQATGILITLIFSMLFVGKRGPLPVVDSPSEAKCGPPAKTRP